MCGCECTLVGELSAGNRSGDRGAMDLCRVNMSMNTSKHEHEHDGQADIIFEKTFFTDREESHDTLSLSHGAACSRGSGIYSCLTN